MNLPDLLESKYLEWRQSHGVKKNETEFAQWLGFQKSTVSTWWRGKSTPNDERIIRKLASKLGNEVYDALGLERPNALLAYINEHFESVDERVQKAAYHQVLEEVSKNDAKRLLKERKKKRNK